jgi:hypothetical protein
MSAVRDQGKRVERVCEACGKSFRAWASEPGKFCSRACYEAVSGPRLHKRFLELSKDPGFKARMDAARRANAAKVDRAKQVAATRAAMLRKWGPVKCGTVRGYRNGCRCPACTEANTVAHRAYMERRQAAAE